MPRAEEEVDVQHTHRRANPLPVITDNQGELFGLHVGGRHSGMVKGLLSPLDKKIMAITLAGQVYPDEHE